MSSAPARDDWWRSAVIYQVYIRSFADGDGDGLGDIAGLRSRLQYLADLGVDAIWINPWYPSPMKDAGYDVADHRGIEPRFGTMADAEELVADAHALGLRVILDLVPNHASDQHPWFQAALAAAPGADERERFIFRDGRGPHGDEEPNDWQSCFGGPAWTRVPNPDGRLGQWYLHLFAPEQPDFNWEHPEVRAEFARTLRFWFDRGIDGFRIDVAHSLFKEAGLPDIADRAWSREHERITPVPGKNVTDHPHWDRDQIHDVYRSWRRIADGYEPPRVFVAEAWVPDPSRMVRYVRADELHNAFNFDYLRTPWLAPLLRQVIDETLRDHDAVGAPATWVLSNHDVARHVSRFGRPQRSDRSVHYLADLVGEPDLELGLRRSRAATLLMLALPGGAYVYQGEELGLFEVEDLPDDALQDPTWVRTGKTDRGRDGCRVPIPWSGTTPPFGFSADPSASPWLPQPPAFAAHTVERLQGDPSSILELYRTALHLRRAHPALAGDGLVRWLHLPDDALGFERDPGFACIVNVSAPPIELPAGAEVLLASGPLAGTTVPADTAVWLRR